MINQFLEAGFIPDSLIRSAVRKRCKKRLQYDRENADTNEEYLSEFIQSLDQQSIALVPDEANLQHYEVSTEFFKEVLGPRMKYSSCLWTSEVKTLEESENAMLALTCQRAEIVDGMRILELGCGWGSCCLYIAEHFPNCQITAISNSATQKEYIMRVAQEKGFHHLRVKTADMNDFQTKDRFDRVISIEMFEHMRNWRQLLSRVTSWLHHEGKLFLHFFAYEGRPYLYNHKDANDWMARHFFAGGMMPAFDQMKQFDDIFKIASEWTVSGDHYEKTLNAWLRKMDAHRSSIYPLFQREYGRQAKAFWNRWRIFFMACAEVFGYEDGQRWVVKHYLLNKG